MTLLVPIYLGAGIVHAVWYFPWGTTVYFRKERFGLLGSAIIGSVLMFLFLLVPWPLLLLCGGGAVIHDFYAVSPPPCDPSSEQDGTPEEQDDLPRGDDEVPVGRSLRDQRTEHDAGDEN